MKDINGKEIKTGDIVEIKNSYFKGDNRLWLVEHCPGDPTWLGKDISLRKINKNGKLVAKNNCGFWPIMVTVSDSAKKAEAYTWNEKHATIEIVDLANKEDAKNHFEDLAEEFREQADFYFIRGFAQELIDNSKTAAEHYEKVAARF